MIRCLLVLTLLALFACAPEQETQPEAGASGQNPSKEFKNDSQSNKEIEKSLVNVFDKPPTSNPKQASAAMKHVHDGPLKFKARNIAQMRDATILSRYICEAVEGHIQNRFLTRQQFSDAFIMSTLKEFPESLQRTYATCHVEREVSRVGFEAYFRDSGGFLVQEALAGYTLFQASSQLHLLKQAQSYVGLGQPDKRESFARLDQVWKQQDRKQLMRARAAYMRERLDAKSWPVE